VAKKVLSWMCAVTLSSAAVACGSSKSGSMFQSGSSGSSSSGVYGGGSGGGGAAGAASATTGGDGGGSTTGTLASGSSVGGSIECEACDSAQTCDASTPTTVSGIVYDPAGANPLYNITVYVPNDPLPAFSKGASCAACTTLYPDRIFSSAVTDAAGHFSLTAPAGTDVPLVVQTGKWRRVFTLPTVSPCVENPQPDKMLTLPSKASEGDLPDIGISTGAADSLECLPLRIGVDASEYVPGASTAGHIHIFSGYMGATTSPAGPASTDALWDSTGDLMANDELLLSCESRTPPINVDNQNSMVAYTSGGGRVFASHYEYGWFTTGPFGADNLATWMPGSQQLDDTMSFPADIVTTLPNGMPFPEGVALQTWLGNVNALTNGLLPIWFARHNADVSAANTVSQPWLSLDPSVTLAPNATEYFTFDTPVGADAGSTCGRVAYSDLHVAGGPGSTEEPNVAPDYPIGGATTVPAGCAMRSLTPQEKALEFIFFDLASCLLPVGSSPIPPPPK
jgi:hypothetical protein